MQLQAEGPNVPVLVFTFVSLEKGIGRSMFLRMREKYEVRHLFSLSFDCADFVIAGYDSCTSYEDAQTRHCLLDSSHSPCTL